MFFRRRSGFSRHASRLQLSIAVAGRLHCKALRCNGRRGQLTAPPAAPPSRTPFEKETLSTGIAARADRLHAASGAHEPRGRRSHVRRFSGHCAGQRGACPALAAGRDGWPAVLLLQTVA